MNETLPLLHEGDSFLLELDHPNAFSVRLVSILRFAGNHNVDAVAERFLDLDPETKRAVISQVNRRYKGKIVRI